MGNNFEKRLKGYIKYQQALLEHNTIDFKCFIDGKKLQDKLEAYDKKKEEQHG